MKVLNGHPVDPKALTTIKIDKGTQHRLHNWRRQLSAIEGRNLTFRELIALGLDALAKQNPGVEAESCRN